MRGVRVLIAVGVIVFVAALVFSTYSPIPPPATMTPTICPPKAPCP